MGARCLGSASMRFAGVAVRSFRRLTMASVPTSSSTDLVVSVLATRRLVRLVVEDEITSSIRMWAARTDDRLGYLVGCRACSSVWAAAAVTLLPSPARRILALSEGAIVLGELVRSIERLHL